MKYIISLLIQEQTNRLENHSAPHLTFCDCSGLLMIHIGYVQYKVSSHPRPLKHAKERRLSVAKWLMIHDGSLDNKVDGPGMLAATHSNDMLFHSMVDRHYATLGPNMPRTSISTLRPMTDPQTHQESLVHFVCVHISLISTAATQLMSPGLVESYAGSNFTISHINKRKVDLSPSHMYYMSLWH